MSIYCAMPALDAPLFKAEYTEHFKAALGDVLPAALARLDMYGLDVNDPDAALYWLVHNYITLPDMKAACLQAGADEQWAVFCMAAKIE